MRIRMRNIRVFKISNDACRFECEIGADQQKPLLAFLDELGGKDVSAELARWTHKRSLDANAYAWVLIDRLATATRQKPIDVYRQVIREIGGNNDVLTMRTEAVEAFSLRWAKQGDGWQADVMSEAKTAGYTHVRAYYGSSTYDTDQMSRLIESIIQECKGLGIETLPPEELERMIGKWNK